jgi:hypothetical protein
MFILDSILLLRWVFQKNILRGGNDRTTHILSSLFLLDLREHLAQASHVRAWLRFVSFHVEGWHLQPSARLGGIEVAHALEGRYNNMLGGRGHLLYDALLALLVVGGDEQDV